MANFLEKLMLEFYMFSCRLDILYLIYTLLSNATVGALIRNVGPSESMIRLSFNMAAASHTWFRNEEIYHNYVSLHFYVIIAFL